jgi:hypothetical protein
MSLKLNSGIVKCRADCVHAFGCRRELVVLKIADRFERQAGRFAQLALSPAQKCAGGYGLFDSEGLHIGTIADFRGGLSFNPAHARGPQGRRSAAVPGAYHSRSGPRLETTGSLPLNSFRLVRTGLIPRQNC